MSPLFWLIIYVTLATILGIAVYLQWIKSYYWTDKQKKDRKLKGKKGFFD